MAKPNLKSRYLRHPGQSLDEQIDRAVNEGFLAYYLFAALLWVLMLLEWTAKALHYPRFPGAYAIAATIASAACFAKYISTKRRVRNLQKGRDGEREVAEVLDDFKAFGAEVLHDIPTDRGNVDHVVLCRLGIFVIETKTRSKPKKVWELDYDGEHIYIPNRKPDTDPIAQCKAEVGQIRTLLKNSTSKYFPVRGVVVFPGWFVKPNPRAIDADIWVLNPLQLEAKIQLQPRKLSAEDVAMATLHLKQYVKTLST